MSRVLILAVLVMALIAFYYYLSFLGNVGPISGLSFDTADHIAFVRTDDRGNTTLFAVRADGTDLRQLTPPTDVSTKAQPVWARDGKSLLYASNLRDNKITQIYLLGTGSPKQLTYGPGNKSAPMVSSDGKTAGFIVQGAVKTVNLNGTEVSQLMPPPTASKEGAGDVNMGGNPEGPFLSADFGSNNFESSRGIAGTQDVSGQLHATVPGVPSIDQMVMVIADGAIKPDGSVKMSPLDKGHEVSFAWEPNGTRLACSYTELEAMDPTGQTQIISGIRIWSFPKSDEPPVADRSGAPGDTSFKKAGSPIPVNLFAGLGYSIEPKHLAWSPNGSKMAFEVWQLKSEGVRELRGIVVMDTTLGSANPQGIVVTPAQVDSIRCMVTAGPDGLPQNPRWSPDGSRLLYESQRPDGKHDLWIINADGTNQINLTRGIGDNIDGAWSPAEHKP